MHCIFNSSLSIYLYLSLKPLNLPKHPQHQREFFKKKMSPAASSRWCPTPEQLMILEEIYRNGLRTPNASQIQHITVHLSFYGKIEGKNVFYWFQNHKARDRQKLRRNILCKQLMMQQQQQLHQLQQNRHNRQMNYRSHLLHYLEPPSLYSYPFQQLSHFTSSVPQGGVEDGSKQMISHMRKADRPESREMNKSMTSMYGPDWVMMKDNVGPCPSIDCCNRPLETLQLFPITAPSLKEECTTSVAPTKPGVSPSS